MGFLARLIIAIGIVYWLSPAPVNYGADYALLQERQQAETILSALTGMSAQQNISRDEIEALAVKAGKALAALDDDTRKKLIEQYFKPGSDAFSLKNIIN